MQLDQVDGLDTQPARRALDVGAHLFLRVAVRKQGAIPTHLGRYRGNGFMFVQEVPDAGLAAATTVHVCRVPEIDPRPVGGVENCIGTIVAHRAKVATELPTAQADLRDRQSTFAQRSGFHMFPRLNVLPHVARRIDVGLPRFKGDREGRVKASQDRSFRERLLGIL